MPKHFEGELKLPYPRERLSLKDLLPKVVEELLAKNGDAVSLCVRFAGFEDDCLGYVFNIRRVARGFDLSDITEKKLLCIPSTKELVAMIKHVSGAAYDENWQQIFQRLRNEITSEK